METLYDTVDWFVIIESAQTFAGKDKSFTFEKNAERFYKFKEKIIYHKIYHLPPLIDDCEKNRFYLENYQRDRIFDGISKIKNLSNDDIILISDVDEIPSPEAIIEATSLLNAGSYQVVGLLQDHYRGSFQGLVTDEWAKWPGSLATTYKKFSSIMPSALRELVRSFRLHTEQGLTQYQIFYIENSGWHLSYFGNKSSIDWKTSSFSHGAIDSIEKYARDVDESIQKSTTNKVQKDELLSALKILIEFEKKLPTPILLSPGKYISFITGTYD
jgi:beta-1,4-mannosyl-glycoprotein beta-1,4-N-acetylglucosaminyltransferase